MSIPIQFVKYGVAISTDMVRERFFTSLKDAGLDERDAEAFWNDAMNGGENAREVIEEACQVEIVHSDRI